MTAQELHLNKVRIIHYYKRVEGLTFPGVVRLVSIKTNVQSD